MGKGLCAKQYDKYIWGLKYRPTSIDGIILPDRFKTHFNKIVESKNIPNMLLSGPRGCVDANTEFLSPNGWVKISEWNGHKVMQYEDSGKSSFVEPIEYIKKKAKNLYHLKTKYGIDQKLSLEHRFVYLLPRKSNKLYEKPFLDIINQHNNSKYGFSGRLLTTFKPSISTSIGLSLNDLRIMVMVIADGNFTKNKKKCCINLKKERKIARAEYILEKANIDYDRYEMKNGYVRFYFIPPFRDKVFDSKYFKCNLKELEVVVNEVFHWDGNGYGQFFTMSKKSKDFIQYAFSSCGYRSTIYKNRGCYTVSTTKKTLVGFAGLNSNGEKTKIHKVNTIDGFEYCFVVPSSYLILRRNGNIFITGNCGKTSSAFCIADQVGCDVKYINMSKDNSIDMIREDIARFANTMSFEDGKKLVIGDEFDRLSIQAIDALKGDIEQYGKNCVFIFTSNHKYKFIDHPVMSRLQEFDFEFTKEENNKMKKEFYKSVCRILHNEKVKFDKKAIAFIVKQLSPDMRKILNELQKLSSQFDNVLGKDIIELVTLSTNTIEMLFDALKEKDFRFVREFVAEMTVEPVQLYPILFKNSLKYFTEESFPMAINIIDEEQYRTAFSVDKQIPLTNCLVRLMHECEVKG